MLKQLCGQPQPGVMDRLTGNVTWDVSGPRRLARSPEWAGGHAAVGDEVGWLQRRTCRLVAKADIVSYMQGIRPLRFTVGTP